MSLLKTVVHCSAISIVLAGSPLVAQDEIASRTPISLTSEAQQAADQLLAAYPADSEPILMLNAILKGSRMSDNEGWFAVAKAKSLFDWNYLQKSCDSDGDGKIQPMEWSGSRPDFLVLDRNQDRELTSDDFNWNEPTTGRSPGTALFYMADADGNGKVTREEFADVFDKLDGGHQGFLALDEVTETLLQSPGRSGGNNQVRPDRPSPSTLVLGLARQEIGSLQPGPSVGEQAPDFTLHSLDGQPVTLSEELGDKPVVLVFGNFTCGPFRSQSGNIEKFYEKYRDKVKLYLVYVREAHPSDGWWMQSNRRVGIDPEQPTTNEQRISIAQTCQKHLDLSVPFLVDTTDDRVGAMYSGMPNRLYLIDATGKIVFKNGRGPFGFKIGELEQSLVLLLNNSLK